MKYNAVTEELLQELRQVVGEKYVKTDPSVLDIYKADESLAPSYWVMPEVVVLPADARETAEIVKLANRYKVPLTPRCRNQCQLRSRTGTRRYCRSYGADEPHS